MAGHWTRAQRGGRISLWRFSGIGWTKPCTTWSEFGIYPAVRGGWTEDLLRSSPAQMTLCFPAAKFGFPMRRFIKAHSYQFFSFLLSNLRVPWSNSLSSSGITGVTPRAPLCFALLEALVQHRAAGLRKPCPTPVQSRLLMTMSTLIWGISRDGDSSTSLGNLLLWSATLAVKKVVSYV